MGNPRKIQREDLTATSGSCSGTDNIKSTKKQSRCPSPVQSDSDDSKQSAAEVQKEKRRRDRKAELDAKAMSSGSPEERIVSSKTPVSKCKTQEDKRLAFKAFLETKESEVKLDMIMLLNRTS